MMALGVKELVMNPQHLIFKINSEIILTAVFPLLLRKSMEKRGLFLICFLSYRKAKKRKTKNFPCAHLPTMNLLERSVHR